MDTNVLYYGDNLDVLRRYIPDESVDLIYLDPPFNSNRNYNVLFREDAGGGSHAQIEAFEDTWNWAGAAASYDEMIRGPHQNVARILKALVDALRHNEVTAYLTMMAIRLVELHRVLKPTGSIYLHCDPTAGPYLRVILDAVFGPTNFRNEITWQRTNVHNDAKRWGTVADTLFYYGKTQDVTWNAPRVPHTEAHLDSKYSNDDGDGRGPYTLSDMTSPNPRPNMMYEWKGHSSPPYGWRYSRETMAKLDADGRVWYPASTDKRPRLKRYLSEMSGSAMNSIWTDIPPINSQAKERLGYATQKPLALLERVIEASSNPGDIVLDPFCGCGTAVHAAQKLGRQWIGIDVTHLAIGLIRRRMTNAFPGLDIKVIGEPVDLSGAQELAHKDKYQFQWWALDHLGAQPVAGKKKGADKGIDGVIPILAGGTAGKPEYARAIVSVKGGEHVSSPMIRDLKGVLDREGEPIGILLTLANPTKDMITEAAASGFYESKLWKKKFPRIQIITIEDLLNGKRPDLPWGASPFAKAPVEKERGDTERML